MSSVMAMLVARGARRAEIRSPLLIAGARVYIRQERRNILLWNRQRDAIWPRERLPPWAQSRTVLFALSYQTQRTGERDANRRT